MNNAGSQAIYNTPGRALTKTKCYLFNIHVRKTAIASNMWPTKLKAALIFALLHPIRHV